MDSVAATNDCRGRTGGSETRPYTRPKVELRPATAAELETLGGASHLERPITPENARLLVEGGDARVFVVDGRIVGATGVSNWTPWRARAWTIMDDADPRLALPMIRLARAALDEKHAEGIHRIEADVRADFAEGFRWARALGFLPECVMRGFAHDRADHILFARVR